MTEWPTRRATTTFACLTHCLTACLPASTPHIPHSPHTQCGGFVSQPDAAAAPFCTLTPAVDFVLVTFVVKTFICSRSPRSARVWFRSLSLSLPALVAAICVKFALLSERQQQTAATTTKNSVNGKQMSVMLLKFIQRHLLLLSLM